MDMKKDEFGQPFDENFTIRERVENALLSAKIKLMGARYFNHA